MSVQQHIHHSGTCIYNVAHVDEFHFLVYTMTHRDAESVFYNDYSYHFFDLNIIDWSNLQVGLVTSSVTYFYKLSGETPNNADTRNRSFALLFVSAI